MTGLPHLILPVGKLSFLLISSQTRSGSHIRAPLKAHVACTCRWTFTVSSLFPPPSSFPSKCLQFSLLHWFRECPSFGNTTREAIHMFSSSCIQTEDINAVCTYNVLLPLCIRWGYFPKQLSYSASREYLQNRAFHLSLSIPFCLLFLSRVRTSVRRYSSSRSISVSDGYYLHLPIRTTEESSFAIQFLRSLCSRLFCLSVTTFSLLAPVALE